MLLHVALYGMLLGFAGIATLLATNHYGFAIKVTNYFFWFVLCLVLYKIVGNGKKD